MKNIILLLITSCFIIAEEATATISVSDIGTTCKVIGKCGVEVGNLIRVTGIIEHREKDKALKGSEVELYLRNIVVRGYEIKDDERLRLSASQFLMDDIVKIQNGEKCTFIGYEIIETGGVPKNRNNLDFPIWADVGFYMRPLFIVVDIEKE